MDARTPDGWPDPDATTGPLLHLKRKLRRIYYLSWFDPADLRFIRRLETLSPV